MILVTHFACCHQYKGYWRSCPLGWSYFTVMPGLNLRAGGAHAPEFTFGKITDNAQAAVDISRVNRDMFTDKPKKPQTIKSIRVDTQGVEYPAPEKH